MYMKEQLQVISGPLRQPYTLLYRCVGVVERVLANLYAYMMCSAFCSKTLVQVHCRRMYYSSALNQCFKDADSKQLSRVFQGLPRSSTTNGQLY